MYRKLLIASIALIVNNIAYAGLCPTYHYDTGYYVGLSVGPRVNISGRPVAYEGVEGTLSAGYGAFLSNLFYLAGELFTANSVKVKDYKSLGYVTLTNKYGARSGWSYGFDILPGIMINDHVLGYLRLGLIRTKFTDQDPKIQYGGQMGLGAQTNLYSSWDLRAEYIWSLYSKVSDNIGKVTSNQFNLGIVYKFV